MKKFSLSLAEEGILLDEYQIAVVDDDDDYEDFDFVYHLRELKTNGFYDPFDFSLEATIGKRLAWHFRDK